MNPLRGAFAMVAVAVALAACSSKQGRAERKAAGEGGEGPMFELTPLEEQMHEHWGLGGWMRRAVIAGKLDEVHIAAGILASDAPAEGVPTWTAHVESLQGYARAAQSATRLPEVAAAAAGIGATCGACHDEVGAAVHRQLPDEPAEGGDTSAHMRRHAWAAEAMWTGLVVPSDDAWVRGATALAERPLRDDEYFAQWLATPELVDLGTRVHDLGVRARDAQTAEERQSVYGEFLATCADCHTRLRR